MATISAAMVKELRESTGAGMMDCKAALTETAGNMQEAQDWLRKKGLSKAAKKAGHPAYQLCRLRGKRHYSASAVRALAWATQPSARLGSPTSSPILCAVSWSSSASCQ